MNRNYYNILRNHNNLESFVMLNIVYFDFFSFFSPLSNLVNYNSNYYFISFSEVNACRSSLQVTAYL